MESIHILHFSVLGYRISNYIRQYMKGLTGGQSHVTNSKEPTYPGNSTIYFIIKSRFFTSAQMRRCLQDIRFHSEQAAIIIIGDHIDYDDLYRNHYRVFGVIDTIENRSWAFIKEIIYLFLDGIYHPRKNKVPHN